MLAASSKAPSDLREVITRRAAVAPNAVWSEGNHDRRNGQPNLVVTGNEEPDGCGRDQDGKEKVLRGEGDQAVHHVAA